MEVTWLVPTLSALQIQANIQDSTQFLEKLEVIRVIMEGEILYDEEGLEKVRIEYLSLIVESEETIHSGHKYKIV